MNHQYTRREFDQVRKKAKGIVRRYSVMTALLSVGLGLISLWFLNWVDANFPQSTRIVISLSIFALFIGIVGWLLLKMKRASTINAPKCPKCGNALAGDSERIASATGKCDNCGGTVIEQITE